VAVVLLALAATIATSTSSRADVERRYASWAAVFPISRVVRLLRLRPFSINPGNGAMGQELTNAKTRCRIGQRSIRQSRLAQAVEQVVKILLVLVLQCAVPVWLPVLESAAGKDG
jgi:hypothetical protein